MSNSARNMLIGAVCVIFLGVTIFALTPSGVKFFNRYDSSLQKANDATNYETLKRVENDCRSMITSYKTDKLTAEQYLTSEDAEKKSWGEQAKMRANKTAMQYNNYVLTNEYVWKGAVPDDIAKNLEIIK